MFLLLKDEFKFELAAILIVWQLTKFKKHKLYGSESGT